MTAAAETLRQYADLEREDRRRLSAALEDGRIGWRKLSTWVGLFSADSTAASRLLEDQAPNQSRRLENRAAAVSARPRDLSPELERAYEADLASRMGVKVEELI